MTRLPSSSERTDHYQAIIATLGSRYRVIADRSGLGWSVQKRRSDTGQWFKVSGPFATRAAVISAVSSALGGRTYAADNGITEETINASLASLPECHAILMPSFPASSRPPLAASFKTIHDMRDRTSRDDLTDPYLR